MIIERHYSSRPEDEEQAVSALLLIINRLETKAAESSGVSGILNNYLSSPGNISKKQPKTTKKLSSAKKACIQIATEPAGGSGTPPFDP